MLSEIGSVNYEKQIEFIRANLSSGMVYTKIEMVARKLLKEQGRDFDSEFKKWKERQRVK